MILLLYTYFLKGRDPPPIYFFIPQIPAAAPEPSQDEDLTQAADVGGRYQATWTIIWLPGRTSAGS